MPMLFCTARDKRKARRVWGCDKRERYGIVVSSTVGKVSTRPRSVGWLGVQCKPQKTAAGHVNLHT
jgi:hypothetical protein